MSKGSILLTILCMQVGCSAHHQAAISRGEPVAEALLVVNARVWTADADRPEADAFLIREGRFVYVGDEATARAKAPDGVQIVDAHGRRILPGLIDSHIHLIDGGLQLSRLNLRDVPDRAAFIQAVADRAAQTPDGQWIQGGRWSTDSWKDSSSPTREWIDAVTTNHPVLLSRMDGHEALANSVALNVAGIDRHGPQNPAGGVIERDPKTGEPTGILKDHAMELVRREIPKLSDAELDAGLKAAMKHANANGITAVHTMSEYAHLAAFDRARSRGALTLRVRQYISEDDWLAFLDRAKAHLDDDWVTVAGFKAFADGSLGSRTAWMSEPYSDNASDKADWCGLSLLEGDRRGAWSRGCYEVLMQGYAPATHAIGDAAIERICRNFLGYSAVCILTEQGAVPHLAEMNQLSRKIKAEQTRPPRIEHAQHLTPDLIPMFSEAGIVASMQPLHKADDARYAEKAIGAERCKTSYAFRSLIDAGALVAFGSDWPVVSLNPFKGVRSAVTGLSVEGKVFVPEQNITVPEALTCYTKNAARAAGDGATLGMIKDGYLADFVITSPDIFATRPEDIDKVRVLETYVGGVRVYQAAD